MNNKKLLAMALMIMGSANAMEKENANFPNARLATRNRNRFTQQAAALFRRQNADKPEIAEDIESRSLGSANKISEQEEKEKEIYNQIYDQVSHDLSQMFDQNIKTLESEKKLLEEQNEQNKLTLSETLSALAEVKNANAKLQKELETLSATSEQDNKDMRDRITRLTSLRTTLSKLKKDDENFDKQYEELQEEAVQQVKNRKDKRKKLEGLTRHLEAAKKFQEKHQDFVDEEFKPAVQDMSALIDHQLEEDGFNSDVSVEQIGEKVKGATNLFKQYGGSQDLTNSIRKIQKALGEAKELSKEDVEMYEAKINHIKEQKNYNNDWDSIIAGIRRNLQELKELKNVNLPEEKGSESSVEQRSDNIEQPAKGKGGEMIPFEVDNRINQKDLNVLKVLKVNSASQQQK